LSYFPKYVAVSKRSHWVGNLHLCGKKNRNLSLCGKKHRNIKIFVTKHGNIKFFVTKHGSIKLNDKKLWQETSTAKTVSNDETTISIF
jgi:hypothetical protein